MAMGDESRAIIIVYAKG